MKLFWSGLLLAVSVHAAIFQVAPQLGAAGNINGGSYNAGAAQSGVALLNFSGVGCSGVAIAPTVILTAAHCMSGPAEVASAFFTDSGANLASYGVSSYLVHPSFTGNTLTQVDLALVYLTSPIAAWVSIYQIYSNTDEVGQIYQVAGWGARVSKGALRVMARLARLCGWGIIFGTPHLLPSRPFFSLRRVMTFSLPTSTMGQPPTTVG